MLSERREDGAGEQALVVREHGGGQVVRIGVDGVAEQQQLHDRQASIMAKVSRSRRSWMNSLIRRAEPPQEAEQPACAVVLSVVLRLAHELDEHVLEGGFGLLPLSPGSAR